MLLLPLIAKKLLQTFLRNIFVMSNEYQVAVGTCAAFLAGRSIIIVLNAILENAHTRFGVAELFSIPFLWDYGCSILLGLPIVLLIRSETRIEREWWQHQIEDKKYRNKYSSEIVEEKDLQAGLTYGVIVSLLIFVIDKCSLLFLNRFNISISSLVLSFLNFTSLIFNDSFDISTNGYFDPKTNLLASGHLAGISFFSIALLLFFITGYVFRPSYTVKKKDRLSVLMRPGLKIRSEAILSNNSNLISNSDTNSEASEDATLEAPVLIYISTLFAFVAPLLATLTFFSDRFGFPIFLALIIFSGLSYWVWGVDHFFDLANKPEHKTSSPQPSDFETAIAARLSTQSQEQCDLGKLQRILVVVTASGGGIHAAGWTAQVLTGLQKLLGKEFTQAIGLISSVSGGSVGTMYFLDAFGDNDYPPHDERSLDRIFQNAVQDGVDSVGWGLVYRDIWRFLGFSWLINKFFKNQDRGIALETKWQGSMNYPDRTLNDWYGSIMKGKIPTPVFNATLIEDGRRLLVSPMTFTRLENEQKIDSNTLYKQDGQRIKAVTAARLSATFPYVSPSARNPTEIKTDLNYHIIDGGYFDNSGIVTAIEWLEDNLETLIEKNGVTKLVFIEIEAGEAKEIPEKVTGDGGWWTTLVGALQALLSVRDSSLVLRNQQTIDLLLKDYRSRLKTTADPNSNVQHIRIAFPRSSKSRFKMKNGEKVGEEYSQPLSWKLTASQKYVLEEAWQNIANDKTKANSAGTVPNLARLWKEWGFPVP